MEYNTYDAILQGAEATIENAIDYAMGMVWGECEKTLQCIHHARYEETINGIDIYYDYGADYYFFVDEYEDMDDS